MPGTGVFICFDSDHDKKAMLVFLRQVLQSQRSFRIKGWSSQQENPVNYWNAVLRYKLKKTDLVIVLVGKQTWATGTVLQEMAVAEINEIPFLGVCVGSVAVRLPKGLRRVNTVGRKWEKIMGRIDQYQQMKKTELNKT